MRALLMKHRYDAYFESFIRSTTDMASLTQSRLDTTCSVTSLANLHFLIFTSLQLLSVIVNVESQALEEGLPKYSEHWWWFFSDFFNFFCGACLFLMQLGVCAMATSKANALVDEVCQVLHDRQAMPTKRGAIHALLSTHVTGFTIAGMQQNKDSVIVTCWALGLAVWSSLIAIGVV